MTAPLPTTAPLTPPDCDLRDFGYMPLDVRRLLTSDTWLEAADDPKLGHVLICLGGILASSPGGIAAGQRSGARPIRHVRRAEWGLLRERAMKDWRLCSDGRLYHPVVAEKALEAWLERLAHRQLGAVGNAKRWGAATDVAPVESAMAEACSRLSTLNPQSRVLARASTKHPAWNRCGIAGIARRIPRGSQGEGEG